MEHMRGTTAPIGEGPPVGVTGSLAQEAVAAYEAPAGDGRPHCRGPTSWGDGESCPGGGRCLWSACGGRQAPLAWAHKLGGRGVLPRRRSLPMEHLRGTVGPIGAGPPVGVTGSLAQEAVTPYGAPAGDGSPHWRGPTSWGDGESSLGGGRCLWSACRNGSPHRRTPTSWGDGESCPGGGHCG